MPKKSLSIAYVRVQVHEIQGLPSDELRRRRLDLLREFVEHVRDHGDAHDRGLAASLSELWSTRDSSLEPAATTCLDALERRVAELVALTSPVDEQRAHVEAHAALERRVAALEQVTSALPSPRDDD